MLLFTSIVKLRNINYHGISTSMEFYLRRLFTRPLPTTLVNTFTIYCMQAGGQVKFCNAPPTPHLPPLPPHSQKLGVQTNGACHEAIFSCDDHDVSSLGGMTIKNRDINLIMRLTLGLMSWRNIDTDPTRRKYSTSPLTHSPQRKFLPLT